MTEVRAGHYYSSDVKASLINLMRLCLKTKYNCKQKLQIKEALRKRATHRRDFAATYENYS